MLTFPVPFAINAMLLPDVSTDKTDGLLDLTITELKPITPSVVMFTRSDNLYVFNSFNSL